MSVPSNELVIDMTDDDDFELGHQLISNGDGSIIKLNTWDNTVTIISEKEAIQYWMRAAMLEHKYVSEAMAELDEHETTMFYRPNGPFMLSINTYADHDEWAVAEMEAVSSGKWDDMDEGYE